MAGKCEFDDMLKPLAYVVWMDVELRNVVFDRMKVVEIILTDVEYGIWLGEKDGTEESLTRIAKLPLVVDAYLNHIRSSSS
jgi:hypothetical protein